MSRSASQRAIRKAYRSLAKKYHPDVTKLDKEFAEERFIAMVEAYKVLKDPARRREYDRLMGYDRPKAPARPVNVEAGYTLVWDRRALRYRKVYHGSGSDVRWVESPYSFMERRRRQREMATRQPGPLGKFYLRLRYRLFVFVRYVRRRINLGRARDALRRLFRHRPKRPKRPPHKIRVAKRAP